MRPKLIVVAGRAERDPRLAATLAAFAERAGAPLLAEPTSGARRGPAAIAHYDALLRDPDWAAAHAPDLVLRVGDLPTSKPLRHVAGGAGRAAGRVRPRVRLAGPGRRRRHDRRRRPAHDAPGARGQAAAQAQGHLLARRLARGRPAPPRGAIAEAVGPAGLNEPRVAAELGTLLPARGDARSSPPRCRSATSRRSSRPARRRSACSSNRGANGIDGTVSTAFGVAAAVRGLTVLLIGDVALAHDIGGLLAAARLGPEARDRADRQRRRRHLPLPPGRARRARPSSSTSRRRTASTSPTPPRCTASATSAPPTSTRSAPRCGARWPPTTRTIICVRTDRERERRRCTAASGSPSGPPHSVRRAWRTPLRRPCSRSTADRALDAPHDLEGHRPGRHRRGRQAGRRFHALVTRARAARERPLRARACARWTRASPGAPPRCARWSTSGAARR